MSVPQARPPLPRAIRALFFVRLINSMGNFVFPFLTMLLTVKLGYSKTAAGAFMSTAAFAAGLAILAGGKIADAFGRKRTIAALQIAAALLLGLCAVLGLVPIVPLLIAISYVLLQASWPVFNALVADIAPAESRKRAYALLYWGNNIGFSLGPIMAGYLFNAHASYMFIGNAVSLAAVSAILIFGAKVTRPAEAGPGAGEDSLPAEPDADACDGASDGACAEACDDAEPPVDEAKTGGSLLGILRERPILIAFAAVNFLMNFVYQQHLFGLPVFLNDALGSRGPAVYGMVMTTNGLTVVLLTALVTTLLARARSSVNMAVAALFYAVGFGLLFFCSSAAAVLASTAIWTIGEIVSATNAQVFIASLSPCSHRGRVNAFVMFITGWGATLAPVASGAYASRFGSRAVWPAVAGLALLASVLMALIARREGLRAGRSPRRRSA